MGKIYHKLFKQQKMKIKEIRKKVKRANDLMKEHSLLDSTLKAIIRIQEEHPEQRDELSIDEKYFQNVTRTIKRVESELSDLFK